MTVQHFYYCLLVSILIHKRKERNCSRIDTNIFILKWLRKTESTLRSDRQIDSEVEWLRKTISKRGMITDVEAMIKNVYYTLDKINGR